MLRGLREEVNTIAGQLPLRRPIALRRAQTDDALLCCDLPLAAAPEVVERFVSALEARQWRVWPIGSWLYLDKPIETPEVMPVPATGEVDCCLQLLMLHPDPVMDEGLLRRLVKAAEQGAQVLEKEAAALHRDWAWKLRAHQPLPGLLLPYFWKAVQNTQIH